MFQELEREINIKIKELSLFVDNIHISNEDNLRSLNVCLDSEKMIDVEIITEATKIINPIIDSMGIAEKNDIDVVDIYSKEKGDDSNE